MSNAKKGRSPEEVADILEKLYFEEFGGKKRGRYRTSRLGFRKLAKRRVITDIYVNEVFQCLLVAGLVLVNLDNAFCVLPENVAKSYRRIPARMLRQYSEGEELTEVEDDDDDDD